MQPLLYTTKCTLQASTVSAGSCLVQLRLLAAGSVLGQPVVRLGKLAAVRLRTHTKHNIQ